MWRRGEVKKKSRRWDKERRKTEGKEVRGQVEKELLQMEVNLGLRKGERKEEKEGKSWEENEVGMKEKKWRKRT